MQDPSGKSVRTHQRVDYTRGGSYRSADSRLRFKYAGKSSTATHRRAVCARGYAFDQRQGECWNTQKRYPAFAIIVAG